MKRLSSILLCAALAFGITACSRQEQSRTESVTSGTTSTTKQESEPISSDEETQQPAEPLAPDTAEPSDITENETDEKTLVVYFTWSSNTEGMAETIAGLTEGDIFEIVPANPYPEDYTTCTEVALAERDSNARPEILSLPDSVSEYDNIIIGYPIWWHTAPMIIGTFLESYDLTGIDIYPFSQSASMDKEQFAQSMEFVRETAGTAEVHDGLFAKPSDTRAITEYLEQNGLI
ncbi:MAG: flavodoxin [Oscillospiraceae bacterium]